MNNKCNNFLWLLFFSWVLLSGAVNATCVDKADSACCQSLYSSAAQTSSPHCAYSFSPWTLDFFDADKNDYCCKQKGCSSQGGDFLNSQNLNCQNHSPGMVLSVQSPGNTDRMIASILDGHKSIQTIPIYTLIQSFLC